MAWFGFYEASSFSAAGLYEWTQPVINNDFNLYYGVGGHLAPQPTNSLSVSMPL